MVLEITNPERDLLFALIESAHREMIQEIELLRIDKSL